MESCSLLFSGGLDSSVCLFELLSKGVDVYPLFVRYDQTPEEFEYEACLRLIAEACKRFGLETLNINVAMMSMFGSPYIGDEPAWMDEHSIMDADGETVVYPPSYVPGRNTIFAMLGIQLAYRYKLDGVVMGVRVPLTGAQFPDQSQEWVLGMQALMNVHSLGNDNIRLFLPLMGKSRADVRALADHYGIRQFTTSCNVPNEDGSPCGNCNSCEEDYPENKG